MHLLHPGTDITSKAQLKPSSLLQEQQLANCSRILSCLQITAALTAAAAAEHSHIHCCCITQPHSQLLLQDTAAFTPVAAAKDSRIRCCCCAAGRTCPGPVL
jgi:hypothetical protein